MTTDEMLADAIRTGSQSATQASRFMSLATEMLVAVNEVIKHLECSKADGAKDILIKARKRAGQQVLKPGIDLVETVRWRCRR